MSESPTFITHYYLPETGPLRSLSDLREGADDPVFLKFLTRYQRDPTYRRRYGRDYLIRRREVEERLRKLFIARGGKPARQHPFYFTLGASAWFRDLNAGQMELRLNLVDLDPATTSITYPDSFIALTQASKPYHNQVFLLGEIQQINRKYNLPANDHLVPYERYWETEFELYVEVQIWEEPEAILLKSGRAQ